MDLNMLDIQAPVLFDDNISLFETHAHLPYANTSFAHNDEIRIVVQLSDSCVVPGMSALHLTGRLSTQVESVPERVRFITNGLFHLFKEIRYELNGVEIDRTNQLGVTSFMKGLVSMPKSQQSFLENMGWNFNYTPATREGYFDVIIPLKMMLGLAEDHDRLVVNMKHEIVLLRSNTDDNCIVQNEPREQRLAVGGNAIPDIPDEMYKIVLKKVEWLLPSVKLSDSNRIKLLGILQNSVATPLKMGFRSWETYEYPLLPASTKIFWTVKTSTQLEKPRFILFGLQTNKKNNRNADATRFDLCQLRDLKVYLNNQQYPYLNLDIHAAQQQFGLAYDLFAKFQTSYYGKPAEPFITSSQWFEKYPIFVIDCSHQSEFLKTGAVECRIELEARENIPNQTSAYCVILHDRLIEYSPMTGLVTKKT